MTRATALIALAFTTGTAGFVALLVHIIGNPGLQFDDLAYLVGSCLLVAGSVIAAMHRRPSGSPETLAEVYEMGYQRTERR